MFQAGFQTNITFIDFKPSRCSIDFPTFSGICPATGQLGLVNVISISKGIRRKASFDNIHLPNGKSMTIDKASISHQFVQEIRDETHRYAITLQKKKMRKTSIKSSLDDLSGIGNVRKKMLLRYFGSLEQIKRASVDDLSEVSGIGKSTAQSVYKELHT